MRAFPHQPAVCNFPSSQFVLFEYRRVLVHSGISCCILIMSNKQALIFGASGIAGWAFTRECLVYPAANTFDRVIALSYRTLDKNYFTFDTNSSYDDSKLQAELSRLDVYDGIDLSNNSVLEKIANIPDIEKITHVFYSGILISLKIILANPWQHMQVTKKVRITSLFWRTRTDIYSIRKLQSL